MGKFSRIGSGFIIMFLVYLALSAVVVFNDYRVGNDLEQSVTKLGHANKLKETALQSLNYILTIHGLAQATLLDPNNIEQGPRKTKAFDDNQKAYGEMKELAQTPEVREMINQLVDFQTNKLAPVDTKVLEQLFVNKDAARKLYYSDYEPLLIQYEDLTHKLVGLTEAETSNAEHDLLARTQQTFRSSMYAVCGGIVVLGLVTVAIVVFLTQNMSRRLDNAVVVLQAVASGDLTRRLEEGTDELGQMCGAFNSAFNDVSAAIKSMQISGIQVAGAATELSATVKEQEVRATEQLSSTVEVVATARQIAATTKELVRAMHEVAKIGDETAQLALRGKEGLEQVEETTSEIMTASSPIVSHLSVLNQRANNINSVITTITKVADQTNLLSLNAAIEAEKAGESGRGFGVVANEIRRLADQTAVATLDIERMVKEMQTAVSSSVVGMDKFSQQLGRGVESVQTVVTQLSSIIEQVQSLASRFELVSEGMEAQMTAADQICQAMNQLNSFTQQTTGSIAQSNAVAQQLKSAAVVMQEGVSRFQVASV